MGAEIWGVSLLPFSPALSPNPDITKSQFSELQRCCKTSLHTSSQEQPDDLLCLQGFLLLRTPPPTHKTTLCVSTAFMQHKKKKIMGSLRAWHGHATGEEEELKVTYWM